MDEPLSNLDAKLRGQIRTDIAALQARLGITMLYVTHDQTEAMTLGRRVAVMRRGRLQQVAPPHELYTSPANVFVAGFIGSPGMNVLRAALEQEGDVRYLRLGGQCLPLARAVIERHSGLTTYPGEELLVGIRPEHLAPVDSTEARTLSVTVSAAESLGHETIAYTSSEVQTITTDAPDPGATSAPQPPLVCILPGHHPIAPGEVLHLRPDPEQLHLFHLHGQVLA
jgi:multiple sugar transport system ATP-binding protein